MARRVRPANLGSGIEYFSRTPDHQFYAWLAGFFDGEGSVWFGKDGKGGVGVSIGNTNRDVVESIQRKLGFGTIEEVTHTQPGWNTLYLWRTRRAFDVRRFHSLVRPHLTIKCVDFDQALRLIGLMVKRREIKPKAATSRTAYTNRSTKAPIKEQTSVRRLL